jgi:hypothetical protein
MAAVSAKVHRPRQGRFGFGDETLHDLGHRQDSLIAPAVCPADHDRRSVVPVAIRGPQKVRKCMRVLLKEVQTFSNLRLAVASDGMLELPAEDAESLVEQPACV